MNFYQEISMTIDMEVKEHRCPCSVCVDPKKEKPLRGKTFEQVKEEAAKYGLYLTFNDGYTIASDTHIWIFSKYPLDDRGVEIVDGKPVM